MNSPQLPQPGKRRHAAKGSRRIALGLSVVSTVGLAGWMYSAAGGGSTESASPTSVQDSISIPSTSTTLAPTTSNRNNSTTSTTEVLATGSLRDGTYTGTSSSTRWGPVQVKITVEGGKITDVQAIQYPANDNRSLQISRSSIPRLVQSTLTAQSASVSSVSGATYTSASYKKSLQSAIDQSRAKASQ